MNDLIKPDYKKWIPHFNGFQTHLTSELTKNEKDELVAICDRFDDFAFNFINPMAFSEPGNFTRHCGNIMND